MPVQCCFTSTETVRLIRTESPGRPPRLWHSSWTLGTPLRVSALKVDSERKSHAAPSNRTHASPTTENRYRKLDRQREWRTNERKKDQEKNKWKNNKVTLRALSSAFCQLFIEKDIKQIMLVIYSTCCKQVRSAWYISTGSATQPPALYMHTVHNSLLLCYQTMVKTITRPSLLLNTGQQCRS